MTSSPATTFDSGDDALPGAPPLFDAAHGVGLAHYAARPPDDAERERGEDDVFAPPHRLDAAASSSAPPLEIAPADLPDDLPIFHARL